MAPPKKTAPATAASASSINTKHIGTIELREFEKQQNYNLAKHAGREEALNEAAAQQQKDLDASNDYGLTACRDLFNTVLQSSESSTIPLTESTEWYNDKFKEVTQVFDTLTADGPIGLRIGQQGAKLREQMEETEETLRAAFRKDGSFTVLQRAAFAIDMTEANQAKGELEACQQQRKMEGEHHSNIVARNKQEISKLEREVGNLEERLKGTEGLEKKLQAEQQEAETLRGLLDAAQSSLEAVEGARKIDEGIMDKLRDSSMDFKTDLEAATTRIAYITADLEQTKTHLTAAEKRADAANKRADAANKRVDEANANLNKERDCAKTEHDDAETSYNELRASSLEVGIQNHDLIQEILQLKIQLATHVGKEAIIQTLVKETEDRMEKNHAQNAKSLVDMEEDCKQKMGEAAKLHQKEKALLETRVEQAESENTALQKKIENLEKQLRGEAELTSAAARDQQEIQDLKAKVEKKEKDYSELESKHKTELEQKSQQCAQLRGEKQNIEAEKVVLEKKHDTSKKMLNAAIALRDGFLKENERLQASCDKLQHGQRQLQDRLKLYEKALVDWKLLQSRMLKYKGLLKEEIAKGWKLAQKLEESQRVVDKSIDDSKSERVAYQWARLNAVQNAEYDDSESEDDAEADNELPEMSSV